MEQRKKEKFRYLDVCAYYKDLIRSGGLKSGDKVPSIRACAVNLSVSRTTVENAYNILSAEGYLIPKEKSGYYVSGSLPGQPADYSSSGDEKADDGIVYDLLNSSADKKNFDFRIWNRYIKSALRNPDRLLSYGQAQGEPDLRVAVAEYIAKERSVFCSPDQIVIGAGIQTLLSLLCVCLDENKSVVFGLPFPEDTTRALISIFKEQKLPLVLVEESGLTLNFANDTVIRAQKAISSPLPEIAPYDGKPIYQATTFANRCEDDRIRTMMPPNCHAARWNDQGVDLILNGGGKVAGIRYVLEQEGISPEECIAFGDAENDIDMLSFVGIGVAMGNAQDPVKEIADYVTSDADDDGIEKALRYWRIL